MRSPKKGFTLTEVIIVITILAVMAGLAVPGYFRTVEQSRINEAVTNLNIIHMGQKIYKINNGSFWAGGTVDCASSCASVVNALNIDIAPSYYTTFTFTITASGYNVRATRNATQGGNTAWYYQYNWDDATKTLATSHNP